MEKKKPVAKEKNKDLAILVLLIPVLFILAVSVYLLLIKVAKSNKRVCDFVGNVWLVGVPSDPTARKGCFTYEELYSGD